MKRIAKLPAAKTVNAWLEKSKQKRRAKLSARERELTQTLELLRENKRVITAAGFTFKRKHSKRSKLWMAAAWGCAGMLGVVLGLRAFGFLGSDAFSCLSVGFIVAAALAVMRSDQVRETHGEDDLDAIHRVFEATDKREELRLRAKLLSEAVEIERAARGGENASDVSGVTFSQAEASKNAGDSRLTRSRPASGGRESGRSANGSQIPGETSSQRAAKRPTLRL